MEWIIAGSLIVIVVLVIVLLVRQKRGGGESRELIELKTLAARQADELAAIKDTFWKHLGEQQVSLLEKLAAFDKSVQESISTQQQRIAKELAESRNALTQSLGGQSEKLTEFYGNVGRQLQQVTQSAEELNRQSSAIAELRQLLASPTQRGYIGEAMLDKILNDYLPREAFEQQYRLGEGIVDAVVKLGDRLVPIDSKYPLEDFARIKNAADGSEQERRSARKSFVKAVRARIDEAAKYVRPEANTVDFGIVFLPAEGIYAEAAQRRNENDPEDDLLAYANERKIVLVSPSLLFAYIRTVYLGLKSLKIEEKAEEILKGLAALKYSYEKVTEPLRILGRHLSNARDKYDEATRLFERAGDKLGQLTVETSGGLLETSEPMLEAGDGQDGGE